MNYIQNHDNPTAINHGLSLNPNASNNHNFSLQEGTGSYQQTPQSQGHNNHQQFSNNQYNVSQQQQMTPQYLHAVSDRSQVSQHSNSNNIHNQYENQQHYHGNNNGIQNQGVQNQFIDGNNQSNQNQASIDEQRRQDILLKLQQERELRRKYVQEGKANEFKLDTLSSARGNNPQNVNNNQNQQQHQHIQSHQQLYQNHNNSNMQQMQKQMMQEQQHNNGNRGYMSDQFNSNSKSFDNRGGAISNMNQLNMINDNDSIYSGNFTNQNQPVQSALSQQYNQNMSREAPSKQSDLVNKLLNERRASKSKTQSFVNQSQQQDDNQSYNQAMLNQPSHTQSQISPVQIDNINDIGGFNPEALYQEDVIDTNRLQDDADDYNKQYLSDNLYKQQNRQNILNNQQQHPFQHSNPNFKSDNTSTAKQQFQNNYQEHQQLFNQTSQSSMHNYYQQQQDFHHVNGSGEGGLQSNQSLDDQKYRDAVEYAKMQIQQELRKKQQYNQIYNNNDFVDSYPSERIQHVIQGTKQQQMSMNHNFTSDNAPEPERRGPPRPSETQRKSMARDYQEFNGGLPPSVKQMDKSIANSSLSKTHTEMNKKTAQRSNKQATQQHHFNYESEDDQKYRMTGGVGPNFQRPKTSTAQRQSSQTRTHSQGPPEYMKNTVNTDLKRGQQATISKTKQVITDAERKFQEECTFKPQINDYQVPTSKEFSKEERWKKLTEPKTTEIQKRELIKAKIEQEEAIKSCPFKPQIQKSAKKIKPNKENELEHIPLPQRLMHEADIRKEKREKLKRELEQQQMKDCSFKPQLMTQSSSVVNINKFNNQAPIHERVNYLQKEKNEKLQKLRMKSEQEQQELTFHPQVNQKSAKITTVKRMEEDTRPKDVVERLYQDAANRIDKQMNHTESYNEQLNRDYSFQPQISKTSNYISEKSDLFNGNLKDFHDRQQAFLQKQQEKRQEHQQKYSQEAQCTFKPEINVTSDIIVESDPKRGAETEEERYYRLYKKDMKRQEIVKEMIEREVYQQYTFKPQINKISKTLAKGSSIDELAYNPNGKIKKELLQEQLVTQEVNYCTFRPETNKTKKFDKVESTYKFNDCESLEQFSMNLKQKLKEKQEKIAKVRKEREYDQQKDCTFKPLILDKEPATSKDQVVVVRGLGRHLELKELQKKKEEDKKLREAEVFGLNHKFAINAEELDITNPNRPQTGSSNLTRLNQTNNTTTAYTVPQPFELSSNKQDRKNKLLKELNDKQRSECTFQPSTNEGRNRKLIKEILEEAEDKENDTEFTQDQLNYYQNTNNHFSSNF